MPVFPKERMAEDYAKSICTKLVDLGVIPRDRFDECVTKVKSEYSRLIDNIDRKWAEGLVAKYGLASLK